MSAPFALSILDFQHPGWSVALACAAEEWGYRRYWLGEHHSSFQCANPLLLGALLAGTTNRLRIGSGGVSMTYRSALQVAEDARLIEFMMPGRFDLGVTRGLLASEPVTEALLEGRPASLGSAYAEKVRVLHGLVTGRLPHEHPLAANRPYLEGGPPLWVLGLSRESAHLAGSLGAGFCFSLHHNDRSIDGSAIMRQYRSSFVPSPEFPEPASIVVVRCICAASEEEARAIEAELVVLESPPSETLLGSPNRCATRIADIAAELETDEVMIIDFIQKNQEVRSEMYRLLAYEMGLMRINQAES